MDNRGFTPDVWPTRIVLTFIPLLLTNMENFLPEVTSSSNSAVQSTVAMDYRVLQREQLV